MTAPRGSKQYQVVATRGQGGTSTRTLLCPDILKRKEDLDKKVLNDALLRGPTGNTRPIKWHPSNGMSRRGRCKQGVSDWWGHSNYYQVVPFSARSRLGHRGATFRVRLSVPRITARRSSLSKGFCGHIIDLFEGLWSVGTHFRH